MTTLESYGEQIIEEEHLSKIVFSDEVQSAIEQVLQSTDPLVCIGFNLLLILVLIDSNMYLSKQKICEIIANI